ncbi:MAG: TRAP transporter small permease [Rhizobacter sp.]|nr:TRAP transporter small permease [Burkholderiaceae bacterium]MCO5123870.1 TRAP transporter small permease [Rhizobacter sp.]
MGNRWGRASVRALEIVIVACLAVMAVLVFGNVVLRYAFNSGIAVSEELSRLLFVWLIFLGAILASVQRAHIGFDALVQRLPLAGRKLLVVLTGGLMLWACGMFVVGGWKQTEINLGNSYPVLGISYGWLYGVAIVFGGGMALAIANNIWRSLRDPGGPELTKDLGDRILEKMPEVASSDKKATPR